MKKSFIFTLVFVLSAASAMASVNNVGPDAERNAHREEMRAIKKAQRQAQADSSKPARVKTEKSFWEKEGERSGLGNSGSRLGGFLKNLNPVPFFKDEEARYEARKKKEGK